MGGRATPADGGVLGRDRQRAGALSSQRPDTGSAVVDFVLVGALTTIVLVGIVQLAVVLHVRNTLVSCAAEGARAAARADADPAQGAARARDLITRDLSPAYARDVEAGVEDVDGLTTVVVRVHAPLPVIGLLGVGRSVDVRGHAVREQP